MWEFSYFLLTCNGIYNNCVKTVCFTATPISVLFLPKTLDNGKHRGYNNSRTDLLFLH